MLFEKTDNANKNSLLDQVKGDDYEIEIIPISDKIEDLKTPNEDLVCEESKEFANEIMCVICQSLVKDPTSCKNCQNLFCKKCIQDWNMKNYKCPMRCARFENMEIPKSTKNVINNIKFKCAKNQIGCKEIVTYENYENHLKMCDFIKYKCANCEFTSNYDYVSKHSKNCPDSFIKCKFCEKKFKKNNFNILHSKTKCLEESSKIFNFFNYN